MAAIMATLLQRAPQSVREYVCVFMCCKYMCICVAVCEPVYLWALLQSLLWFLAVFVAPLIMCSRVVAVAVVAIVVVFLATRRLSFCLFAALCCCYFMFPSPPRTVFVPCSFLRLVYKLIVRNIFRYLTFCCACSFCLSTVHRSPSVFRRPQSCVLLPIGGHRRIPQSQFFWRSPTLLPTRISTGARSSSVLHTLIDSLHKFYLKL